MREINFRETKLVAEQGYANAQTNLGIMYARGDGVPQNKAEAVRWLQLAVEQGHGRAEYFLELMNEGTKGGTER